MRHFIAVFNWIKPLTKETWMKLSKTILWAVGGIAMAGMAYAYKAALNYREKAFEEKLVKQELETLEGEGGICLG